MSQTAERAAASALWKTVGPFDRVHTLGGRSLTRIRGGGYTRAVAAGSTRRRPARDREGRWLPE
ncbi:MAG: hypothetical protein ABEL76_00450 [Bradymonadaceae bacterium]